METGRKNTSTILPRDVLLAVAVFMILIPAFASGMDAGEDYRAVFDNHSVDPDVVKALVSNNTMLMQVMESYRDEYNSNVENLPAIAVWLFGNELITFNIDDVPKVSVLFEEGKIKSITEGASPERTLDVYLSSDTLVQIVLGKKQFEEALRDGSVQYKASTFLGRIKFALLGWVAGMV